MQTPEDELEFWDGKARHGMETARNAIAADPWTWTDEGALMHLLDPLRGHVQPGDRVLDLGCGAGRVLIPMAKALPQCQLVGVDISPAMITHARAAANAAGIRVELHVTDGRSLPVALGQIGAAYSVITFQHIPKEAAAGYIDQIGRRLMLGGCFRFQVHEGTGACFLGHQVTEDWVVAACAAGGLSVVDTTRIHPPAEMQSQPWLWVTAVKV